MKTVALVGRPNVGKSRLFNRLVGRRTAIVEGTPGITRDRVESMTERDGRHIRWIDTGGIGGADALAEQIALQAEVAVEAADLVILVTDIREGLQPLDREIANRLRSARKVMIAANKADDAASERSWTEFTALGFDPVVPISAEHGRGFGEFEDEVMKLLGADESEPPVPPAVRVAIVGRPNVGKSSLLNRLLGKERAIVSEVPGTTRDALEDVVEIEIEPPDAEEEELPYEAAITPDSRLQTPDSIPDSIPHTPNPRLLRIAVVDTAGIRKKRRDYDLLESIMVSRARDAVLRSHVAIVVADAVEGLTDQDAKILRAVFDMGRGAVLALNKWDAVTEKDYDETVRVMKFRLGSEAHVPIKSISAKTGLRVRPLLIAARDVARRTLNTVKTGDLIRCLGDLNVHAPRGMALKYGIQKSAAPPTFLLFGAKNPPASFQSLVRKSIRSLGDFDGVPILLEFRK